MRQLPRILLVAGATLIVVVALLISGLRLMLPYLSDYRESVLTSVSAFTGSPIKASQLHARWQNFGPVLEVENLSFSLSEQADIRVGRLTLALDVWASLLHGRWQFRDLTFWQLHFHSIQPLFDNTGQRMQLQPNDLTDLFLRQFDHFDLRDSTLSFLTPSGQQVQLGIPHLTWLNETQRHRAEGEVNLSSFTGQHGVLQVRLDLSDQQGLLDNGRIWLQADDVDIKPWLGQWMRDNTTLSNAHFSLCAWVSLRDGQFNAGDLLLKKGGAIWRGKTAKNHTLSVDNVTAHLEQSGNNWVLTIPKTNLQTDNIAWPQGRVALLWQPARTDLPGPGRIAEWRVRATHLDLARINVLLPLLSGLPPALLEAWQQLQPTGQLDSLALDIPQGQPERTHFQVLWRNAGWQSWKQLPGMAHFSAMLSGSLLNGKLVFHIRQTMLSYTKMFRAPLEVAEASGAISWQNGSQGLQLQGKHLAVQAHSLWAKGDFSWEQPDKGEPRLNILAGINLNDAAQAWRYFPESLMGRNLVKYLTAALKGGTVKNATLVFAGNPKQFPFRQREGQFQVTVPLRNATFQFQPGWPALAPLNIDLDFRNAGLWMAAPQVKLGKVSGDKISAVMTDYSQQRLVIDGAISGDGKDVSEYFLHTPLHVSLGAALQQLQMGGLVRSRLHLDIPLNGGPVVASGNVILRNNSLLIKPIDTTIRHLTGRFRYNNGTLESDELMATWFGQPLDLAFQTRQQENDYRISVNLLGNWALNKLQAVPAAIGHQLQGTVPWQGDVAVSLARSGGVTYHVSLKGDLKNITSQLPAPLQKTSGKAMPFKIAVTGDPGYFDMSGGLGAGYRFNSRWLTQHALQLDRAILVTHAKNIPTLPKDRVLELNLPALNGEAWAGLLATRPEEKQHNILPESIKLLSPRVMLAGQEWHDLDSRLTPLPGGGTQINITSKELTGSLMMPAMGRWLAHLNYLYYNPQVSAVEKQPRLPQQSEQRIDFSRWPALDLRCDECWLRGQKFGLVMAELTPGQGVLTLRNGLIDTGNARLTASGEWSNHPGEVQSSLTGTLSGKKSNEAASWFGFTSPLQDAPFDISYDLHWRAVPWQPDLATLSGMLDTKIGAGYITEVSTGSAGQLLRLFSVDALLRKMRFDFRDTFSQSFYFDAIKGRSWIKNGIMHTDKVQVDGLEADIVMQGVIDLVRRRIDMEAIVTPEVSVSVGVATAFAVNPVIGAAVFAASRVLGPLWSKISLLRYRISGSLDQPEIHEILHKPHDNPVTSGLTEPAAVIP
ncbi:AsmA2 domain-containing protein YhdP [Enterobacteriaceae bacterium LUAb1]